MAHNPLAPVVKEHGVWTYEAPEPTDFFTREAFVRAMTRFYLGLGPKPESVRAA